jgi:hypothetical protein
MLFLLVAIPLIVSNCSYSVRLYHKSSASGTFWERKSRVRENTGSGFHIISNDELLEYTYENGKRRYEDYGGDILGVDTLYYVIEKNAFIIEPYYKYRILDKRKNELVLIDSINDRGKIYKDTFVLYKSSDQTTLPTR